MQNPPARDKDIQRHKIVVVGASAAGLKAACRARRLLPNAEVTVVESSKYISYSACGLPYYLSGEISDFESLTKTSYDLIKNTDYYETVKDVTVRTLVRSEKIERENNELICKSVDTGNEFKLQYDNLVLATGSVPLIPDIPGNILPGVFTFTKAEDAITLRKACETGAIGNVALIGAGYIGIELCEAFSSLWGIDVTLFEEAEHVLPGLLDPEIAMQVESMLKDEGIEMQTNSSCTSITEMDNGLCIETSNGKHDKVFDRVIFGAGIKPNSKIAKSAGLKIGKTGGISVNEFLQTSDPDIYAAGDCVELHHRISRKPVTLPLGSLANRMGRIIGDNLAGKNRCFYPVVGSTILKIFDWNVACIGLNTKQAKDAGYETGEAWGVFDDKVGYYPGVEKLFAKLIFDTKTEKVIGVQAAGKGDVVRRVDGVSALMQKDAILSDIFNFEPAYAPPYGDAIDPLHFLAYTADSMIHNDIKNTPPEVIKEFGNKNITIVDVRNSREREMFPLPKTTYKQYSIPIEQLRNKIGDIPPDCKIITICQRGPRAYEAALILREKGYKDVKFLGGGMLFANVYKD